MGAKHVMFTCARMDATSLIVGNKIIDNKVHKLQNIYC
jgi:hypothetical protein